VKLAALHFGIFLAAHNPETCYCLRMSDSEKPLAEQLDEAIDRVRRELEILESPSTIGGGADSRSVVAALRSELLELEQARAGLEADETGGALRAIP
jgi:hypothetical protein